MGGRQIGLATIAVLTLVALALPAHASHANSSCSNGSAVAVGSVVVPGCTITLTCPSGSLHTCKWTLGAGVTGIGYVAARVFVPGMGLPFANCTGLNSCSASAPNYTVTIGQTKIVTCSGGDVALNEALYCTATVT